MAKRTETGGRTKFPTYKLMSENELYERKQKYFQLLKDVSACAGLIEVAREELKQLHFEKVLNDQWAQYTKCDGLPRVFRPTEVRKFIAKLRFHRQRIEDSTTSWTLNVNERSILTQNIFAKNRTRATLQKQLRPDIGGFMAADVIKLLTVMKHIDQLMDDELQLLQIETNRQLEIMNSYGDVVREIDKVFDQLIYAVIAADCVYMNSPDHKVATWSHSCEYYGIAIWCLRNVGIRFEEMEEPLMAVRLDSLDVAIQIPLSVLTDNLTLRCIHAHFDNISKNAKSFEVFTSKGGSLSAGLTDLSEVLINDWNMQICLQEETHLAMLERLENYNAMAKVVAERLEQLAKSKKGGDKGGPKIVIPKLPKEPQSLPAGMYPDTYDVFLSQNNAEYEDFINDSFHPSVLNLSPFEINLRENIILGGVYSIMFVRRPSHTAYESFNITLHEDGHLLNTLDDIVVRPSEFRKNSMRRMSVRKSVGGDQALSSKPRRSTVGGEPKIMPFDTSMAESPYFIVTIKLPSHLCLWGDPVACQFEECEPEDEVPDVHVSLEDVTNLAASLKANNEKKRSTNREQLSLYFTRDVVDDNIFRNLPIVTSGSIQLSNAFRPTLFSLLRHTRLTKSKGSIELKNFRLDQVIDGVDLQNLQRFCMPRCISSFKFPTEFVEDACLPEEDQKANQKLVVRRISTTEEENNAAVELHFDYDTQNNPERLYPHFAEYDQMIFDGEEKDTAYGLMETLDDIKLRYLSRYKTTYHQQPFEVHKTKQEPPAPVVQPKKDFRMLPAKKEKDKEKLARTPSVFVEEPPKKIKMEMPDIIPELAAMSRRHITDHAAKEPQAEVQEPKRRTHWTREHIIASHFNKEDQIITITTDRLGIFGFAYQRYQHFPFRYWSIQVNPEKADEFVLSLDTFCVRIVLYITACGVRGYVTDLSKEYVAKPIKYLEIVEPILDMNELRRRFLEKNVNIFAQIDASFYIKNGYHSIKHLAAELHTYNAIALNCKMMVFQHSSWNRLASRRDIILNMRQNNDVAEVTMRITPERTTFVEITELCSDNLDVFELQYMPTWRNIGYYADLHMAINAMSAYSSEMRNKDASLIFQIRNLLSEIRPLSFS